VSEVRLENLKDVLRRLKEFLGEATIDWVDRDTLRIIIERKNSEYEITVKCKSDVACSNLRKLVSLIDFLTLF
jgi:predicted transcriptional regulator